MPPFAPGTPAYNNVGALIQGITAEGLNQKFAGQTTVFEYGVVGDGVTDDTVALQNALNDAAGKYWLLLPAGYTFIISAPIYLPANTFLIWNGTIKKATQTSGNFFSMVQINGSVGRITGIGTLDGNKAGQSGTQGTIAAGLVAYYASSPPSPSVLFSGWIIEGIEIQNCVNQPISVGLKNSVIRDCIFHDSGNAAQMAYSVNTHFVDCTSYNNTDDGLGIYGGSTGCSVRGCTVYGCQTGVFILSDSAASAPCVNCSLIGNICYGNVNTGLFVSGSGLTMQSGIVVQGNVCYNNAVGGPVGNAWFLDCENTVISGNTFTTTANAVVGVQFGSGIINVRFANNIVQGIGANLVVMTGDKSGNKAFVIEGNTIADYSTGGSSSGIALDSSYTSAYITCRNNVFSGNIANPYVDNSSTKGVVIDGCLATDNNTNTKSMSQSLNFVNQNGTVTIGLNEPEGNAQFDGQVNVGTLDCTGNITGGGISIVGAGSIGTNLEIGAGITSGVSAVIFKNLPTSDPHLVGQAWLNAGVFTISAG